MSRPENSVSTQAGRLSTTIRWCGYVIVLAALIRVFVWGLEYGSDEDDEARHNWTEFPSD